MKKEFMTFVSDLNELVEKKEVSIAVRDLAPGPRKYDCKIVRAVLSRKPDSADSDVLWVWSWTGVKHPDPWSIKIKAEVGETLPGRPHDETLANIGAK